jgi:hypothetical protein
MNQPRRPNNDFNPDDLTKKSDQHDKLLNALEKRVGTNENFGKTFKAAAADSKSIDEAVEQTIIKLLQHNVETQEAVEQVISKIDGRQMKGQLMGIGKIAAWILSIIITIALTIWVTNIIHDAGSHPAVNTSASSH